MKPDGLPRSANVTVMQPLECYCLDRDAFFSMLDQHLEMARGLLLSLTGMVAMLTNGWPVPFE